MKGLGIVLIVVGIIMLIWTGFSYTKQEKVVDVGPLEVNANKKEHVNWSPYAGGILLIGGVVLLLAAPKRRSV